MSDGQGRAVSPALVIFEATEGAITSPRLTTNMQGLATVEWRIPDVVAISDLRACAKPLAGSDCTPVHLLKWNRPGG